VNPKSLSLWKVKNWKAGQESFLNSHQSMKAEIFIIIYIFIANNK